MYRKLLNNELGRLSQVQYKESEKIPVVIVLDNVRSQHNIGATFRTSDAFSVSKIYLCGICACPPSPEIHKSALGAEDSVDWKYFSDTKEAILSLKSQGYIIISVEQTENSTFLHQMQLCPSKRYAFVFGNEVKGVQQDIVNISDFTIEIPQFGTKHSLNVSVSVGMVIWESASKLNLLQK